MSRFCLMQFSCTSAYLYLPTGCSTKANAELEEFIAGCRDARQARKALALKLVYHYTLWLLSK
jgi:hypothetical protein